MMEEILVKPVEFTEKPEEDEVIEFLDKHEETQIVNQESVKSRKNVLHAVKETRRAYQQSREISHVPSIGLILRLAGTRQIKDAIERVKIKNKHAVFICFNSEPGETWKEFKDEFSFKETELPKSNEREVKEQMEKASTFWIE